MARKSKYDQLVDSIRARLNEMAPENCETIEEAVHNDQILSGAFGTHPSTSEDYSANRDSAWDSVKFSHER